MNMFNQLLSLAEQSSVLGYIIFFLIFLLESTAFIGLAIPGTVFLVIAGFIAARDILDPGTLLVVTFIAILVGDGLSFFWGERGKELFKEENKIFKTSYLLRGEDFFNEHGNKSVILGRFIGPIRPLVAFISGLFKMKARKFYALNIIGAILWMAFYFSLGYFFGHAARAIELWSTRVGLFLFLFILFLATLYLIKRFFTKKSAVIFLFFASFFKTLKHAVYGNRIILKFKEDNPRFFKFIKNRFVHGVFSGLPLTFLSIAFVYFIFLFFGIVENVIGSDTVVSSDMRVVSLMSFFRHPLLIKFFLWITVLGEWKLIVIFSIIASVIFWIWRKRFYVVSLWTTIAGSLIFGYLSKLIFQRVRPDTAIFLEKSFSFPSGHSVMAMAFYGFLVYYFWMNLKDWKNKLNVFFAAFLVIVLIGFSRLYLGVHYISDVWAGYLLGTLWLIIGISTGEWLFSGIGRGIEIKLPEAKLKAITALLITAAIFSYLFFILVERPELLDKEDTAWKTVTDVSDILGNGFSLNSENLTGSAEKPLSLIIISKSENEIKNIFSKAGWHSPGEFNAQMINKLGQAMVLKKPYPPLPLKAAFWNNEVNDLGFEKAFNEKERYNARIWDTKHRTADGKIIYVSSVNLGFKWRIMPRVGKNDSDTDNEREYVFNDLLKTGLISSWKKEELFPLNEKYKDDKSNSDGKIYYLYLR